MPLISFIKMPLNEVITEHKRLTNEIKECDTPEMKREYDIQRAELIKYEKIQAKNKKFLENKKKN